MKVAVFGATGGIGQFVVKHALKKGYEVNAYVRNPDKLTIKDKKLTVFVGQVDDSEKIKEVIKDCHAVINAIGISMKFSVSDTAAITAHKNIIQAMEQLGVKRFVDWSTPSIPYEKDIKSYITVLPGLIAGLFLPKAKKTLIFVNNLVTSSNLDWTIVRFMAPKNSSYTGNVKVSFGDKKINFSISREDIGAFMVDQLEDTKYLKSMPIIGS